MVGDCQRDAELVVQAQRGDLGALATLLQRHRAGLYAAAVGMLRDRDEAADAVQDAVIAAMTHVVMVKNREAVRGWLYSILRNACRMRLRRNRPIPLDHLPERADPNLDPERLCGDEFGRDRLWAALSRLSDDERLTVLLRHFTRCDSYRAIATISGVPIGTVRSRLHRAHARLAADLLDGQGDPPRHDQRRLEAERRAAWTDFYDAVHERPEPRVYRRFYAPDVHVRDSTNVFIGIDDWVGEERPAVELGVRASIVGLIASPDLTVLEIDFTNPPEAPGHCPPRSTFVHDLQDGRTARLRIHYV